MADFFARRTLAVYRIWFEIPRRSDEFFPIDNIDGHDVLDVFEGFCFEENKLMQLDNSERFLWIKDVKKEPSYCLASVQSGRAGVAGSVVNTATAEEKYGYGVNEADMVASRFALYRYEGHGYAIACIERVPNDAGSTVMLSAFKKYFRDKKIRAVFRREQVKQEQALKAFKGIEDIEVRRYTKAADRSDGLSIESEYISHIARHKRRKFFPLHIAKDIAEDRKSLTAILGIPEEHDGREDVMIRLKGWDGSSRQFVLGDDLRIPLVEMLNDSGEKPLTDAEFLDRCSGIVSGLAENLDRMI